MMIFRGQKFKNNKIQLNTLYTIDTSCKEFVVKETSSLHEINVKYNLDEKVYGLFGKEYKSPVINKNCLNTSKAVDLLCIIIDESLRKTISYIYDIKKKYNGYDVIKKGLEQIRASMVHVDSILVYCKKYDNRKKIGIITGEFDTKAIEGFINEKKQILEDHEADGEKNIPAMTLYQAKCDDLKIKQQVKLMENILDKKVEIDGTLFDVDIIISEKNSDNDKYVCNFDVSF